MPEQPKVPAAPAPEPTAPGRLTIPAELVQKIVSFLVQQPWAQVNEILAGIQRDVRPLVPPAVKPPPDPPLDRRSKKSGNGDLGDHAEG